MLQDSVSGHPLWATLKNFEGIDKSPGFEEALAQPQYASSLHRVFELVSLIRQRFETAPPLLVSIHYLNQLNTALSNVYSELTQYLSNKNLGHITNVDGHIDKAVFSGLLAFPIQSSEQSVKELTRITEDSINRARHAVRSLGDDRRKTAKDLEQLNEKIAQLGSQIAELTTAVNTQKAEATTTVESLRSSYAGLEQTFKAEFKSLKDENTHNYQDSINQIEHVAGELVAALKVKLVEAEKIVQIVGNVGVTGNYQKMALDETTMANRWRTFTLGAFAVALSVGAFALFSAQDVSFEVSALRMLFAFVVASVTLYTGRESARHRTNADRAKRVELELASLGPFLISLPVEQQNELRTKLTDRYFGKDSEPHVFKSAIEPRELLDLIKDLAAKLTKR